MDLRTYLIDFILISIIFFGIVGIIYLLIKRAQFIRGVQVNREGKEGEYFRGLPYNGDIYCIFRALTHDAKSNYMVNFINAALVKWYREGKVIFEYNEEEDKLSVVFKSGIKYDHKAEQMFYHILKSFAGNDGKLTHDDILISLKLNLSTYQYFAENIANYIGDIVYSFNSDEEYKKIFGLKRFIVDFSMIPEVGTNEVFLRDEYITFAILVGCSNNIKNEFKDYIPFNIDIFYKYIDSINSSQDQLEKNYNSNYPFN